jgi:hypothetical protein
MTEDDIQLTPAHLEMAKMIRDKAKAMSHLELAEQDLETIAKAHCEMLKRRGYKRRNFPSGASH